MLDKLVDAARAIKAATPPVASILSGIYLGTGYKSWPPEQQHAVGWIAIGLAIVGALWILLIMIGRMTNWPPLVRLENPSHKPKANSKKATALPKA